MSRIRHHLKSNYMYFCLIFAAFIGYAYCSGYYNGDMLSLKKARLIFSKQASVDYVASGPETWKLADREISVLRQENRLPIIYQGSGGRDAFVSIEILQACERLLNRIELDGQTPTFIDSDSNIIGSSVTELRDLGLRVAREIQYCFLQYGPEVLEIPALESYSDKLRAWGVSRIFTDEAAKRSLENLKQIVRDEGEKFNEKYSQLKLVTMDSGEKEKYIIKGKPKQVEKRKLVTIDRGGVMQKKQHTAKKVEFEPEERKRIIARPKKETRQVIHGQDAAASLARGGRGVSATQALASTRKSGVDLVKLINQEDISEKIRVLGPEARLLLAWQSVVEAQQEFNEETDYHVRNLPSVIDSSVLYQSCPNFSLLNFKNECVEVIMFRNSQISRGFLEGEPTQFYLKDGNILITSNHIIRTAVQELCLIAHESYLPEIMKNSETYLERIHTIQAQIKSETPDVDVEKLAQETPVKAQTPKSRLFSSYKKVITKKGAVPYLNEKDTIWDMILECTSGECINDIVYKDLSYWLIPPEYLLYLILRVSSESYSDSLIILDYTVPIRNKIGNVFNPGGGNVNKICRGYIQDLASSGKADLVVGGIHSNLDNLLQELCRDVEQEVSKNENLLSDKRLLIGTLYELELLFCGILGVSPKGRSTEGFDSSSELDMLSSGPVGLAKDVWTIEECGEVSEPQLNYLLCFGSFSQGFISHLFTNSLESVIPITLLCKTFLSLQKDMKDPYDPSEFGKYLSNMLFKDGLHNLFPFSSENSSKARKVTTNFFVELSKQFKLNLEKNMYINPHNIDSIETIYSVRVCSAPFFVFLPFELSIFPIGVKLINDLSQYGCRTNINTTLLPGNMQPCVGIQQNIINYLHVLAAIIESFTNHFIDLRKLGTDNVEIPVNSLCLWWKHPVNYPLSVVLANVLPFISNQEVSEYILRYSLMMESMNFPGPVKAEKRIEYVYLNPQIYSNRARDLPKSVVYPDFNPPRTVFDALEYYLRNDVAIEYRNLESELDDRARGQSDHETISKKCPELESWQVSLAISFQNSVTKVLKTVLSKLNEPSQFKIGTDILCRWVANNFSKNANGEAPIDVYEAGQSLETEADGRIPWMQPSLGVYLLSTFNVWSQTAYALKVGGVSRARTLDKHLINLGEIRYLFEKKASAVIESTQEPKILSLDDLNLITRLRLNPFVDDTLSLQNPPLESECDSFWAANLMNAFRIYFMEFQRKFIDPIFHGHFDPIVMCEIIKEIVQRKMFQSGFGDVFYRVFKDKKWIQNKQLVRVLVKNAGDWILQTFELPGYPTNIIQNSDNLIECYKLSYSMENRPIVPSLRMEIDDIEKEILPLLEITSFPTLSLKSITSFIRSTDPNTYYKSVERCKSLSESEIRMLVSLSSYLETVSRGVFISHVPQESTKKGLLEELKYEFPMEAICSWWVSVKKVNADPNYSEIRVCWASLLSKYIHDLHSERVASDPELAMQWKPWFTVQVAEAMLIGFFDSVNHNTNNVHNKIPVSRTEEGFVDQSQIRNLEKLESIFGESGNYKYVTPFHRSVNDLNSMPLSYFSYLHLPSEHYERIKDLVQPEQRRPVGHSDVMIGRTLHQIEINMSTLIAYSVSKLSVLSRGNNWKITPNNIINAFKEYRTSDISLRSWLKSLQSSFVNTSPSIQSMFIIFTSYLKEEAKLIKANLSGDDLRNEYWTQIDNFYSLPLHKNTKFTPDPPSGYFPIFEMNKELDFTRIKLPQISHQKPAPLMNFSRFRGRYRRAKFFERVKEPSFLDDIPNTVPSIWPSIGTVVGPDGTSGAEGGVGGELGETGILITSELEVHSKFNCHGLFAWQVNRAAYWAGMLQRYIRKGVRLLKYNKGLAKHISKLWNVKFKQRRFPKVANTNKKNQSFNIFDMCFFYKALNFFHNELSSARNGDQQLASGSWEDLLDNLPYFTINIFIQLFCGEYVNLSYSHVVLFFYELVLEERRIIALKTKPNGIFVTEKEKLKAIYHAPLFPEPKEYVYPGIFFELEPPSPCSWDRVKKIDSTVFPVVYANSDGLNTPLNLLYLSGQPRSDVQLRDPQEVKNVFFGLARDNLLLEMFDARLFRPLNPNVAAIMSKKLPLAGINAFKTVKDEENSAISTKGLIWSHISSTFTNGLDWFVDYSPLASESTFLASINIVETIDQALRRELAGTSKYTEYFHDPSILPSIFLLPNALDALFEGGNDIAENLSRLCEQYMSGITPLSIMTKELKLYESSAQKSYSEYICNEVASMWEPNIPFLFKKVRKVFMMEFVRRIKQEDARLGSKLAWPSTSTSPITAEWHLFSERTDHNQPIKSNSFVGFYNFHYFWDPALLLNVFYSQSETLGIYFEREFTSHTILEVAQTPLVELGSWISVSHSPLYTVSKLITHETLNQLFVSRISSTNVADLRAVHDFKASRGEVHTLYKYCSSWVSQTSTFSKEEATKFCNQVEQDYGRTVIYLYSVSHQFEFIFNSLLTLAEKHPISHYWDPSRMQKTYNGNFEKLINNAVYGSEVPQETKIRVLNKSLHTFVYMDPEIVDQAFLQLAPPEMHRDLQRKGLWVYSKWFFLGRYVINRAFEDAMHFLRLKSTARMELNVSEETSLEDLESACVNWVNVHSGEIFLLNPKVDKLFEHSVSIVDYPEDSPEGQITLSVAAKNESKAEKTVCETFIDLISANYLLFSSTEIRDKVHSWLINRISATSRPNFGETIIGWHAVSNIVSGWARDYSLNIGPHIYLNLIARLSTKTLSELKRYSISELYQDTGINRVGFFYNLESFLRMTIDSAYNAGYLLIAENAVSEEHLVAPEAERVKLSRVILNCIGLISSLFNNKVILIKKLGNNPKGKSQAINISKVSQLICERVAEDNRKMLRNFVESKSNRYHAVKDLHERVLSISKEVKYTSFSFIY